MAEVEGKLIFEDEQEQWADSCKTCGHTRAQHRASDLALGNVNAVNKCRAYNGGLRAFLAEDPAGQAALSCTCVVFN